MGFLSIVSVKHLLVCWTLKERLYIMKETYNDQTGAKTKCLQFLQGIILHEFLISGSSSQAIHDVKVPRRVDHLMANWKLMWLLVP